MTGNRGPPEGHSILWRRDAILLGRRATLQSVESTCAACPDDFGGTKKVGTPMIDGLFQTVISTQSTSRKRAKRKKAS